MRKACLGDEGKLLAPEEAPEAVKVAVGCHFAEHALHEHVECVDALLQSMFLNTVDVNNPIITKNSSNFVRVTEKPYCLGLSMKQISISPRMIIWLVPPTESGSVAPT